MKRSEHGFGTSGPAAELIRGMLSAEEFLVDFLTKLAPGSGGIMMDVVRRHLNNKCRALTTEQLHELHAYSVRCRERRQDPALVVEMIEGLIALREITADVSA